MTLADPSGKSRTVGCHDMVFGSIPTVYGNRLRSKLSFLPLGYFRVADHPELGDGRTYNYQVGFWQSGGSRRPLFECVTSDA
jgi:hypothetical protein